MAVGPSPKVDPKSIYHPFSDSALPQDASPPETQEGPKWPRGARPWVSLVGCFFLMFNSWGLVNAYGTFASYYMQHLMPGQDLLRLGLIGGTDCFIVLILSGLVGRLLDAGFYRYLITAGTVLVTAGMFSLAWCAGDGGWNQGRYAYIWTSQGLTMGLGMACFFVASSQIVATWFPRRRATAIGIVASGASIAGLVYPVSTKFLIGAFGWRNAVISVAGIVLFTCLVALVCAHPNPAVPLRPPANWTRLDTWVDLHAFRNASFCWFVVAIAWMFLGFYAVFFNLEEWATVKGVGYRDTPTVGINGEMLVVKPTGSMQTFYLLGIMNGSSTAGRILAAYLSDKFDTPIVHMAVTLTCSLLVFSVWTTATTISHTLVFVILFGSFSGAVIGLPPASMAWILRHTSGGQSKLGQWTGMMYTCAAIPALIGPVIVGHLITEYNTFFTVQIWSGICLLVAGICMGIAAWCCPRFRTRVRPRSVGTSTLNSRSVVTAVTDCESTKDYFEPGSEEFNKGLEPIQPAYSPSSPQDIPEKFESNEILSEDDNPADLSSEQPRQTTLNFASLPPPIKMNDSIA